MTTELRHQLAVVLRKAAGHYTAAAAEATGRGDHALAGVYTARAQQNQAEADVARAVARYEVASERVAELTAMDARTMTGAQFDALNLAQDTITESRRTLEQAGQLHLIARPVKAVA